MNIYIPSKEVRWRNLTQRHLYNVPIIVNVVNKHYTQYKVLSYLTLLKLEITTLAMLGNVDKAFFTNSFTCAYVVLRKYW